MSAQPVTSADDREERYRERAVERFATLPQPPEHQLVKLALATVETLPSPMSASTYADRFVRWFRWCDGRGVDPLLIGEREARAWVTSLSRYSPKTVGSYVTTIRTLYANAVDEELLARSPFRRVKSAAGEALTPSPALLPEEIDRLLAAIAGDLHDPLTALRAARDFAMVYLMVRVGLRRVEATRLCWADVPQRLAQITVFGKGRTRATRAIPEDVDGALSRWRCTVEERLGRAVHRDEPVFPRIRRGAAEQTFEMHRQRLTPIGPTSLTGIIRERMLDAGLDGPRYAPHALRATAATEAYNAGVDLLTIAHMMRHRRSSETEKYIRRIGERERCAARAWQPSFTDPRVLGAPARPEPGQAATSERGPADR